MRTGGSEHKTIITLDEVHARLSEEQGKRIVLVGGCYDILHFGHLSFLKAARDAGDLLVVALESDEFIRVRKNREPVHTQQQRAEILSSLRCVDYVITLSLMRADSDYGRLVKEVMPSVIAVTAGDSMIDRKQGHADKVGATVKIVCDMAEGFSSSQILSYANILSD